jgi:hypothetical protein
MHGVFTPKKALASGVDPAWAYMQERSGQKHEVALRQWGQGGLQGSAGASWLLPFITVAAFGDFNTGVVI